MESAASANHHRICHINLAGGYRGGERQTELLIKELARRSWPQRLVVRTESALVKRCREVPGLQIVEVNAQPLSAAFAARGAAIVHAHEARAVYSGWFLKVIAGTPFVLTRRIHHSRRRSFARSRAYHASDCVVAISASIAESVNAHYGDLECRVVPSAHANMQNGKAVREAVLGHLQGKTIIGHVGELDHSHKGQWTIIEAARSLAYSHPELHFVLLGEGKDERAFRRAADGLHNVEFIGFVENVEDYMAAFDVFVYPSLHEGLGSSLLDAMAFGLPIVASDVGGIPEIVDDRVNGLLVPPGSAHDLAQALKRVVGDAELRGAMRQENRKKVAGFCVARMASAYEDIYRSVLRLTPAPLMEPL
jgi:glycosyltransferase involved in cell wall biosynthesis